MTDLPRAIYLDLTGIRLAKPRMTGEAIPVPAAPPVLRLVPPLAPVIQATPSDGPLLALLELAARPGESADAHHRRKEQAIGELFAQLTVEESDALHQRLTASGADDPVVALFGRLVVDRRERLLAFLRGARRRAVIEAARRPRVAAGAPR